MSKAGHHSRAVTERGSMGEIKTWQLYRRVSRLISSQDRKKNWMTGASAAKIRSRGMISLKLRKKRSIHTSRAKKTCPSICSSTSLLPNLRTIQRRRCSQAAKSSSQTHFSLREVNPNSSLTTTKISVSQNGTKMMTRKRFLTLVTSSPSSTKLSLRVRQTNRSIGSSSLKLHDTKLSINRKPLLRIITKPKVKMTNLLKTALSQKSE